jgi:hypothetical protein
MNLCNNGHQEVCFEGRECPVCEKIKEIESLKEEVISLENAISTMTGD